MNNNSKNQYLQEEGSQELNNILKIIFQKLSTNFPNWLPESQQQESSSKQIVMALNISSMVDFLIKEIHAFEKQLQQMQQSMRKHIKNEIELKLYYQHLEDVIRGLKKQIQEQSILIDSLKSEVSLLRAHQKKQPRKQYQNQESYFSKKDSHNNHFGKKQNQSETEPNKKIDTISKIKSRLNSNKTSMCQDFDSLNHRKQSQNFDGLFSKRQSFNKTLQQLHETPLEMSVRNTSNSHLKSSRKLKNSKSKLKLSQSRKSLSKSKLSKPSTPKQRQQYKIQISKQKQRQRQKQRQKQKQRQRQKFSKQKQKQKSQNPKNKAIEILDPSKRKKIN